MYLLLIAMGFGAGLIMSALGTAWGAICVPILIIFGIDPVVAKGSALTSEISVAVISSSIHKRFGHIRSELVLALLLGVLGIVFGSWLSLSIPSQGMRFIIGIYEIIIGSLILFKKSSSKDLRTTKNLTSIIAIGFIAGFAKGFLGSGWGPIGASLLILLGIAVHEVIASTIVVRIAISTSSALMHIAINAINWNYIILLTIGGVIGSILGAFLSNRLEPKLLNKMVGLVILLLGVLILVKEFF